MSTQTLYHGTHHDQLVLHPGICLTDDPDIAALYGPNVFTVQIDFRRWFNAPHLGDGSVDGWDTYLGDHDLDDLAADYDLITFGDMALDGPEHITLRVITEDGLAALTPIN